MREIIKSKIFIFFFLAITLVSIVIFLNLSKTYQSEVDILLIPKSKITAMTSDQIQNNTQEIITSLNFYDALLDVTSVSTEISLAILVFILFFLASVTAFLFLTFDHLLCPLILLS